MLYLLWTAINGAAVVYFFASCVTAARAVRERAGLLPLLVVGLGLLSLHGSSSASTTWSSHPAARSWTGAVEHKYLKLEEYHLAAIELGVTYALAADSGQVIHSHTLLTGLKLGENWQPTVTQVTIKNHKLYYAAAGFMDWKLLGTTIYREPKQLTGVVQL